LRSQNIDKEKKIQIAFDIFDSDHNGVIDRNELKNVFKVLLYDDSNARFLETVCKQLYDKMVTDMGEDLPDKLSLSKFSEEFGANIDSIIENIQKRESDKSKIIDSNKIESVFNIIDEDHSGYIDHLELKKAFFMIIGVKSGTEDNSSNEVEDLTDKQKQFLDMVRKNVEDWLSQSDENHDGKISLEEFTKFFSETGLDMILQFHDHHVHSDLQSPAAIYFLQ
jgi:Ca2+-binding EF-hand superfamily protein